MNRVILIGRLTKDPELRYSGNNVPFCPFTLAVDRFNRDEHNGPTADFIRVVVFNRQAENLNKYIKKGEQIAVEGRIQTRSYDNENGQRVYVTEVIASRIMFLSNRTSNNEAPSFREDNIKPSDMKSSNSYEEFGQGLDKFDNIDDFLTDDSSYDTPF